MSVPQLRHQLETAEADLAREQRAVALSADRGDRAAVHDGNNRAQVLITRIELLRRRLRIPTPSRPAPEP